MKVILLRYKSYKKDLEKKLNNNIEKALHAVGGYVEGQAKTRAPVGVYKKESKGTYRSGPMAGKTQVGGNLRSSYTYATDSKEKSVTIGSNVHYAPYLELGTSKQKPQPHLKPAVEENKRNIKKIVEKNVGW